MIATACDKMLLAQTADGAGRVIYEVSRLRDFDNERLFVAGVVIVGAAIIGLVSYLYRRDTVELPKGIGILLAVLRCVALAGLLVFFLGIERRTTHEVVHESQVAVLVDSSLSMGLADGESPNGASRLEHVVKTLTESPLIADLRKSHEVNIVRFDEELQPVVSLPKLAPTPKDESESPATSADEESTDDWSAELRPRGTETRLGYALAEQLRLSRDAPLAAVVVISDGAQNAGVEPSAAVETARQARVPIFTLGVGSTEPQRNIALRDLVVPARAFPGDTMQVTGYLQANGYAGRLVDVELNQRQADDPASAGTPIASERVVVGADGEMTSVTFDYEPTEPGNFLFQMRVVGPGDDLDARDNQREAEVAVVDRQTRVLLIAGGPTRDYQFLRNQLFRDRTMMVDVLLQTAQPGISQDADRILDHFPSTREELYPYDCIVAFDPDWTQLDAVQIDLLQSWVGDEAGGMIVVAGPIYTARWVRSTEHAPLRDLYPVVFQQRLTLLDDGHYGGEAAWPLHFERAGREARFLWLEETDVENESAWGLFPGVFGYYNVKGEKPGATVYARFSDPEAQLGGQRPVYIAEQFYGAGRVLYLGSGELWRLRSVDPAYFEVLTTKLIRHVGQGRILRGSSRGALLVDRDRYELGETVVLRARLTDARHEPLVRDSVTAQVLRPDGSTESIKLAADIDRPGMYTGQLTVLHEGTYQVVLPLPDSDEEPLARVLQVRIPDTERTHSERNEPLLASVAEETGGVYYPRLETAVRGDGDHEPLVALIESRAEVKLLKGAPDQLFARMQMEWLLGIIAGSLFLEWIVRRMNRLA
jgi:hypothetical protein